MGAFSIVAIEQHPTGIATGAGAAGSRLVDGCRANDQASWRELVETYSRYVNAIAVRGFRLSQTEAEDVFQEVFARTWRNLDRIHDDAALRPWIAQVTRRLCVDRLRAAKRVTLEAEDGALADLAASDQLGRIDLALDVRDALARLSPDCQDVVDRFFTRDQSYAQISEQTGMAQGTIASRISRCLTRLRTELEEPLSA
jgi:RNA polymerase sigma-70 factor (ECF subfamily)